jgi:cell division transport system permease protein
MQRNGWHTVAALAVMTLTFFILSLFALTMLASNKVLNFFEQQPQILIYLKDDASQQRVQEIRTALEGTGKVKEIHYTSKDEALSFFKEEMKDNPVLLENVSANILPASLEVSPNNVNDLDDLVKVAKEEKFTDFIEDVRYQQDIAERLASWTSTGRLVGLVLVSFLVVVSLLIMLVTIGVNISAYKDEIEIMRLVGASSWYIQGPFIFEGILYGTIASILSVSIVYLSLPWVAVKLQNWLTGINIFPIEVVPVFGGLLLAELLFGIILGVVGSYLAMRRSLKV